MNDENNIDFLNNEIKTMSFQLIDFNNFTFKN